MIRGIGIMVSALLFITCTISACKGTGLPAVTDERVAVVLDPSGYLLSGESTITLAPFNGVEVSLELHPEASVLNVAVDGEAAPFFFAAGRLAVHLPAGNEGQPRRISVIYRARFNDPLPGRTVSTEDPSYGVNAVIGTEGVFLGGGVAWFPHTPALPARLTIEVTAPAGIEAITAGELMERRTAGGKTISLWREAHPTGNPSLSAGRYLVSERKFGALPLYTYFLADDEALAAAYLDASARYLKFYEGLFGPYPFEKFAVVENFIPTGYGFPSYTLLGGSVIRLPFIISTSLPHEISHNWWGNGVLVDYREGNWSEGLATYVADYLLEEKKSPAAGRNYRSKILTDYSSLVSPSADFPLDRFITRTNPATRAIGYGKSAMLFHMVRTMIGDTAFFNGLREVCREKLYHEASWSDFIRAFSHSSGKELAPFMEQWLTRPGGPRLSLSGVTSRNEAGKWLIRGTVVQEAPLWQFPITLDIATAAGDVRQTLSVKRERTPFAVTVTGRPRRVVLDPDSNIFHVLAPEDIPPAVNRIKGSRRLLAVVTRGCRASRTTLATLLASLGQRGADIADENAVTADLVASHDLLVCGVPDKPGFFPPLPDGMSVGRDQFAISHEVYSSASDALFAVAGRPHDPGRVTALFLPLSEGAAADCATRITHYGSYGLLVFSGGKNRQKGLLPAAASRMAVPF
jgi:aminopeptidase N